MQEKEIRKCLLDIGIETNIFSYDLDLSNIAAVVNYLNSKGLSDDKEIKMFFDMYKTS
ncbi:hypothetical protein IHV10_20370 [Fictibacillus sp. 5RED26]|uniref:hypothetical protein n=1 Tax=Fictibacillus sp. 5RED26 TaxID=2745876 RepID=UPI0018CD9824|nr:hypothetical protein [Fictibacillus sp. 5RED26]MBH0158743.1 hypothetical protein [Fictibacillus sp. 5RED26]